MIQMDSTYGSPQQLLPMLSGLSKLGVRSQDARKVITREEKFLAFFQAN